MDCKYHSPDHQSGTEESKTKREKTSIINVAWKALLNLDESMKDIKCWENERSILKRKIYNQNEKIQNLAASNGSLTFQVENLKSLLAETMEKSEKNKFEEFYRADKKIDQLVVNSAVKVIWTIENLSNNFVSVHETMNDFRNQNKCLQIKIDKLKAMIRVSGGNGQDFRDRVNEFKKLIFRMDEETRILKNTTENINSDCGVKIYGEKTKNIAMLVEELKNKLKNDRHALLAGGNHYWSVYLEKIGKLESSSEGLLVQLEITKAGLNARSCGTKCSHSAEYQKDVNQLEELVKRVESDLKILKTEPMLIGTEAGGESCMQYSKKIGILEKLVATCRSIIDKLIIDSKDGAEEKRGPKYSRVFARSKRKIEELVELGKKFKSTVKELEMAAASADGTKSIRQIRQLENSVKRLRKKLDAKKEENDSLGLELTGAKIAFEEKSEALAKLYVKYEKIVNKLKNRGQTVNEDQQRISSLLRELEQNKIEAREIQKLKDELNELRVHVANFVVERANLLEELNKSRAVVKAKENLIVDAEKEKKSMALMQMREKNETEKKLVIAGEEIKCLKEEITELREEIKSNRIEINANEATKVELNQLEAVLKETNERLLKSNNECAYLKSNYNEIICANTKMEFELSRIKIQNEALIGHLNSEKVTTAETLKDCQKLIADYQLQECQLEHLKSEKSSLEKNLNETEREKNALKSEVNQLGEENATLRNDLSSLKSKLSQVTQNLEESDCRRTEIESQLRKLNEENKNQRIHLDSLMEENERLNNELDNARSDKLNIAGTLNDWRLQYEETKNLLESKAEQANFLDHQLKRALEDGERLKMSETAMKLEITKSLEANVELKRTIDVLNSDKTRLEEQLTRLNNECQTLEKRLCLVQSDNEALQQDSSASKQRVDKLSNQVKKLMDEMEENARVRLSVEVEHRETTEIHQRKLKDFEIEHNALKGELLRLRAENSSLKSETDRISLEYEKIRGTSGKKAEISRLTVENEELKFELCNLRNANSKADREIQLAKNEREKLCQKLCALYTEKCTLKMHLEKMKADHERSNEESRQLTLRFDELKIANDKLHKSLEEAFNDIANRDDKKSQMEDKLNMLQSSIEELKQRHRSSEAETEELRSRNINLGMEISIRNKENVALMEEVDALRSVIKTVKDDNSKMRTEFAKLEEELEALKGELARARAESGLFKTQFEAKQRESCKLESENAALKDKLEQLKHSKTLDAEEDKLLRVEYEKLLLHKVTLEKKLIDAQKEIGKYTIASSKLNCLADKLKGVLEYCAVTKQLVPNANEDIVHIYRATDQPINNKTFKENIQAT